MDGLTLATCGENGRVTLWDVSKWRAVTRFSKHGAAVGALAFSPDGKLIASSDRNGVVLVWEIVSGEVKAEFTGQEAWTDEIAFSPDGRILATLATIPRSLANRRGAKIVLRDTENWELLGELQGHKQAISALAFHPMQAIIVSASGAGKMHEIRCWDTKAMKELFGFHFSPTRHSRGDSLAFSPDGKTLAMGTNSSNILIWNWQDITEQSDRGR
jgi:WD40 repeat protein